MGVKRRYNKNNNNNSSFNMNEKCIIYIYINI